MFVVSRARDSWVPRRIAAAAALLLGGASATLGLTIGSAPEASSQIGVARAEVRSDRQGWYWERNQRVPVPGTGVQQELFPAPAQQHHLQISLQGGEEDKRAFVGFNALFLEGFEGSAVRSFTFSAAASPASSEHSAEHAEEAQGSQTPFVPPANSGDEGAQIIACPVTTFLADGADGDPVSDVEGDRIEPAFDCGKAMAAGRRSPDGARWTFDLTAIASLWATGETSDAAIVLRPAPDPPGPPAPESTWTVELHGRQLDGLEATLAYTLAAGVAAPAPPPPLSGAGPVSPPQPGAAEPSAPEGGGQPPAEPRETVAQPPALPVGAQGRYPWYAVLPWIGGAMAVALGYHALREGARADATRHRVAELLRSRRRATSAAVQV